MQSPKEKNLLTISSKRLIRAIFQTYAAFPYGLPYSEKASKSVLRVAQCFAVTHHNHGLARFLNKRAAFGTHVSTLIQIIIGQR